MGSRATATRTAARAGACAAVALVFGCALAHAESGTRSVVRSWERTYAGAVGGAAEGAKDYLLEVPGTLMFLFAELEGDVFQSAGRGTGGHGEAEAAEPGGSGGGCSGEGGPGNFRLELYEEGSADPLCFAERPKYPGWMRDPRLACALAESDVRRRRYILRVSFAGQGGEEHSGALAGPPGSGMLHVFRLRLHLVAEVRLPGGAGRVRFAPVRAR